MIFYFYGSIASQRWDWEEYGSSFDACDQFYESLTWWYEYFPDTTWQNFAWLMENSISFSLQFVYEKERELYPDLPWNERWDRFTLDGCWAIFINIPDPDDAIRYKLIRQIPPYP